MSRDKDLENLIKIIDRLEIAASERDIELHHARESIHGLQNREAAHSTEYSVLTAPPLKRWDRFMVFATVEVPTPPTPTVEPVVSTREVYTVKREN